ncbi:hypothetical protein MMC27_003554 [Xylographa pallens]|nr:hypothetical protein [Xylographa pallens]
MATTTLMTFRVQAPRSIYNVHLLGSWDNFSKPYPMQKDPRTGSGHWRGCHSFTNIVCDGDTVKPGDGRNGGLKMGGTYWYYYQLNGDIEHHNAAEPSTTTCPFLPGQIVNILEVPIQVQDVTHGRCDSTSSVGSVHYTLNPEDKYLDLRPPAAPRYQDSKVSVQSLWDSTAVQKPQERNTGPLLQASYPTLTPELSELSELSELPELPELPELSTTQFWNRLTTGSRRISTSATLSSNCATSSFKFQCIRRTQSLRTMGPATIDSDRPLSRGVGRHEVISYRSHCDLAFRPSELLYPLESIIDDAIGTRQPFVNRASASVCTTLAAQVANNPVAESNRVLQTSERSTEASGSPVCSDYNKDCTPTSDRSCPSHEASVDPFEYDELNSRLSVDDAELDDPTGIIANMYAEINDIVRLEGHHAESASSSARTSEAFSPSLTSSTALTGYMSPLHMGQPNTPETTEFEEYFLSLDHDTPLPRNANPGIKIESVRPDKAYIGSVGFGGYNLMQAEHASSLTIPSSAPNEAKAAAVSTTYKATSSQDRVTSWNDGSPALEDLFNELSYLGEIIT